MKECKNCKYQTSIKNNFKEFFNEKFVEFYHNPSICKLNFSNIKSDEKANKTFYKSKRIKF